MDIGLLFAVLLLVGSRGVHVAERYETLDLGSRHTRLQTLEVAEAPFAASTMAFPSCSSRVSRRSFW